VEKMAINNNNGSGVLRRRKYILSGVLLSVMCALALVFTMPRGFGVAKADSGETIIVTDVTGAYTDKYGVVWDLRYDFNPMTGDIYVSFDCINNANFVFSNPHLQLIIYSVNSMQVHMNQYFTSAGYFFSCHSLGISSFSAVISGSSFQTLNRGSFSDPYSGDSYSSGVYSLIDGESYYLMLNFTYSSLVAVGTVTSDTLRLKTLSFVYDVLDPVSLPEPPTKPHHDFVGWYLDEALTIPYTDQYIYDDSTVLYAKFILRKYTISFVTNTYSSLNSIEVDALTYLSNFEIERYGYTLVAWCTDEGLTVPFNFANQVTDSMTLYAKWELTMVRVVFMVDGNIYAELSVPMGSTLRSVAEILAAELGAPVSLYQDEQLITAVNMQDKLTAPSVILYGAAGSGTDTGDDGGIQEVIDQVIDFVAGNWYYVAGGAGLLLVGGIMFRRRR
jgi:uncharacterized repeat protein (TIGR02543 family)